MWTHSGFSFVLLVHWNMGLSSFHVLLLLLPQALLASAEGSGTVLIWCAALSLIYVLVCVGQSTNTICMTAFQWNVPGTKARSVCDAFASCLSQMNTWCVFVKVQSASRPPSATVPSASPLLKLAAVGLCLSAVVWKVKRKSFCSAPRLRLSIKPFFAARRTGATATPAAACCCLCFLQVLQHLTVCFMSQWKLLFIQHQINILIQTFFFFPFPPVPEGEPVRYRVETLALFVLAPVIILVLLSVVSVLACRRLHHGRLQRLQEFDTEQGDGLITSSVGDSTLAVRIK